MPIRNDCGLEKAGLEASKHLRDSWRRVALPSSRRGVDEGIASRFETPPSCLPLLLSVRSSSHILGDGETVPHRDPNDSSQLNCTAKGDST